MSLRPWHIAGSAQFFDGKTTADATLNSLLHQHISVIMPCLNEAETLEFCILEAQAALAEAGIEGEVVIADNGGDC